MNMNSENQYCLFAGECYYPRGGAGDFVAFGGIEELKELYLNTVTLDGFAIPWGQICESATMKILWEIDRKNGWIENKQNNNQ